MTDLRELERITPDDRAAARKRVEERRGLAAAYVAYGVVNSMLVGIWLFSGGGYFWPGWVMAGWGVGMLLATWGYIQGPVRESDIDAELRRMQQGR